MLRLRYERKSRKLKQRHVAAAVDVPASHYCFFENRRMTPTSAQLQRLADFFQVPPDDLFREVVLVSR